MSAVEDIWSSMKDEVARDLQDQRTKMKKSHVTSGMSVSKGKKKRNTSGSSVEDLIAQAEAKELKAKKAAKKAAKEKKLAMQAYLQGGGIQVAGPKPEDDDDDDEKGEDAFGSASQLRTSVALSSIAPPITASECMLKIARDIQGVSDMENVTVRRKALQSMHDTLFVTHHLSDQEYADVFQEVCKPVFKRFADPAEKARELALRITNAFFERTSDLTLTIGYFIPALMARMPPGAAYDEDMKVFVSDLDTHEAYRRGKAVDRQDRTDPLVHTVLEPSEEIRLLACRTLFTLVHKMCAQGAATVLHPYFHDIIMFAQAQLRDPFPELKGLACELLEVMCHYEDFTTGMKFFAVGLCRALLPVMRHRHAKVRAAAVSALTRCMAVPDRAKCKGAGTDAIVDLVGFKEENHLSVAAFYKSEVQINYLADVAQDSSVPVRLKVTEMLHIFLTELQDRYDHQTRLLPYLLDLLCDPTPEIAQAALVTITKCGKQYEDEHADEIIERRQYGVDGDRRMNIEKPLPPPFQERPRLGQRLYVRGNCKRFLKALTAELTNWVGTTRLKSANLLKMVVIFMEEHLTMEVYVLLPEFIKALGFAKDDQDKELEAVLLETYELTGRFILPEVYVHYILPRLSGDPKVVQFGVDTGTRCTVMQFLGALLEGSMPQEIAPLFEELVTALTDPFVITQDSSRLMNAAMAVLRVLLGKMVGRGKTAIEAHFLNTGRLGNLRGAVSRAFKWLCISLSNAEMRSEATSSLLALAQLDRDSNVTDTVAVNVRALFLLHGAPLLHSQMKGFSCDPSDWDDNEGDRALLSLLISSPWGIVHEDQQLFVSVLDFLIECVLGKRGDYGARSSDILTYLASLLHLLLTPIICRHYNPSKEAADTFAGLHQTLLSTKQWDGVRELFGPERVASALDALRRYVPLLTESFVAHDRWSRARLLQRQRLNTLALFLSVFPQNSPCAIDIGGDGDTDDENEGCETTVAGGREEALLHTESMLPEQLSASKLLSIALELPKVASTPLEIRLHGVCCAQRILKAMCSIFDGAAVTAGRAVKQFAKWKGVQDTLQVQLRETMQKAAEPSLATLVHMLADSSDAVRVQVLEALLLAVPLVLEDSEASVVLELDRAESRALDVSAGTAESCMHFSAIGTAVLKELVTAEGDVAAGVEALLRSLAVLDPASLLAKLAEIKALLPPLTEAQRSFKEELPAAHESFKGIQDHCELLLQFSKK